MSVVVAIPKNGVVYFGADTQSTSDTFSFEIKAEECLKIHIIGDWVIGTAGNVANIQLALSIFRELQGKELSKSLLIREFLPKFIERATEMGFMSKKDKNQSFCKAFPSLLIACKGELYEFTNSSLDRLFSPQGIGSGSDHVIYSINRDMEEKDINDNIINAITDFASQNIYVNKGVTLANTRDLRVEVVKHDRDL